MLIAGALPLLAFLIAFLALGNRAPQLGWRRAFIRACVLLGASAVVLTETLSLFEAVRPTYLAAGWSAFALAAAGFLARHYKLYGEVKIPRFQLPRELSLRLAAVFVVVIVFVTAVVAWIAPPNTWDSLNYHMSRVAHWAQMGAVRHYATGIEVQNSLPPGAELLVLNLYVLAGSDRLANLVQWFAMLSSLIGVARIAAQLGAGRVGQWLSVTFAATLPMGLIQASSTMNDYVVALWVVAATAEALTMWKPDTYKGGSPAYLGLAIGLGMLTKPTAYPFLILPGLLAIGGMVRKRGIRRGIGALAFAGALAIGLNLGYFARNIVTYQNPISPESQIAVHRNTLLGVRGLISNTLRNAALHAGTPSPHVNKALALTVRWIHEVMKLDVNDPRTTSVGAFKISAPTTNETSAGNSLHAWLSVPVLLLLLARPARTPLRIYALLVLLTFLIFSLVFKWQIFGSRYHMPFFLLFSPIFGMVAERLGRSPVHVGLVIVFSVASWPWLLSIDSRPVVSRENISNSASIFQASRRELYFSNAPYLRQPYEEMATLIKQRGCAEVGVSLVGAGLEYPIWVVLGAPDPALRLEWIVAGTPSEIYRDPNANPCAVICQHCPVSNLYAGLPLIYQRTEFSLFMDTRD